MFTVESDYPVAAGSNDHLYPFGTMRDNSASAEFNAKLFGMVPVPHILDLGCAGGGFAHSVILDGGVAVGIEGSDYNLRRNRAEWAAIPGNLFTADITQPFQVYEDGMAAQFNVVTAWEVLEHLPESGLAAFFDNVRRHLSGDGLFLGTASHWPCNVNWHEYHATIKDIRWWLDRFHSEGLTSLPAVAEMFEGAWVRQDCVDAGQSKGVAFRWPKA